MAEAGAVRRELLARRDGLTRIEAELERFDARVRLVEARHGQLAFELTSVSEQLRTVETSVPGATAAADAAAAARARAEEALAAAEARWREAESDASRWQARADALAQALDAANDGEAAAVLEGMVGVAGSLVNHLVIELGAERAVAAALGDAMGSVIVSGRDEARTAVERLASGDASAWLLVLDAADTAVTTGATLAPEGARPLASCVRGQPPGAPGDPRAHAGGRGARGGGLARRDGPRRGEPGPHHHDELRRPLRWWPAVAVRGRAGGRRHASRIRRGDRSGRARRRGARRGAHRGRRRARRRDRRT